MREQVLSFREPGPGSASGRYNDPSHRLGPGRSMSPPDIARHGREPGVAGPHRYVSSFMLEPLLYIQTIFSQVRKAPPDPQTRLHADAFHSSVKAWFFSPMSMRTKAPSSMCRARTGRHAGALPGNGMRR